MSYNLIFNGEFTQPIISTDSFIYSTDFTTDQQNKFIGVVVYMLVYKMAFAFPDPILINKTQFCSI